MNQAPTTTAHVRVHSQNFANKSLSGEVCAGDFKWDFVWRFTNGELLAYMDENVSQKAAEQGREQNPSFAGDPNKILMSYR